MIALLVAVLAPFAAAAASTVRREQAGIAAVSGAAVSLLALSLSPREVGGSVLWVRSGGIDFTLGLALDPLSHLVSLTVAGVALAVFVGSLEKMSEDQQRARFFAWMSIFLGAMLMIVLSSSLLLIYAAWELAGLASFVLIRHHDRDDARSAAARALLVTRAGDVAFLAGWLLLAAGASSTRIDAVFIAIESGWIAPGTSTAAAFLILAGALAKSAQLPFSAWLPGAMAAPAPVSALLHSATMAAAGVYLVLRLWTVFAAAPAALAVLAGVGAVSALAGATLALGASDLKRLLAWSTVSQLGEMMLALGVSDRSAALHHLVTHAAMKSSLFLSAAMIEDASGTRALDGLAGASRRSPRAVACFGIAALSLAAVPPFGGYFAERAITRAAGTVSPIVGVFSLVIVAFGGAYIGRALAAMLLPSAEDRAPPAATVSLVPAALLAVAATVAGVLLAAPRAGVFWQAATAVAGVSGLGYALVRARKGGAAPLLETGLLESTLERVPAVPAAAALAVAAATDRAERALAAATRASARAVASIALLLARVDRRLESTPGALAAGVRASAATLRRSESGFDAAGRSAAHATMRAASTCAALDRVRLDGAVERLGAHILAAGGSARRLQSGKLYLYTAAIFLWVGAVVVLALLVPG